jgi:hypothetical protein
LAQYLKISNQTPMSYDNQDHSRRQTKMVFPLKTLCG